jgi:NADPH:quinone reductase-like Zn-dependent oxidoreductase
MRAATFREYGGPEVMRWEQLDDPACGRDEVIVRARACGLNHSDLDSRAGSSRWPFTMPWVLGAEFAGTVVAVGAEVEGIADGDPVTAYQQFACGTCAPPAGAGGPDLCERFVCSAPIAGVATRAGGGAGSCSDPAALAGRLRDGRRPVRGLDRVVDGGVGRGRARARRCWCRRRRAAWRARRCRRHGCPARA